VVKSNQLRYELQVSPAQGGVTDGQIAATLFKRFNHTKLNFLQNSRMDFHSLSPPRVPSINCHSFLEAGFSAPLVDLAVIRPGRDQRTPLPRVKATLRGRHCRANYISEESQTFLELCPIFSPHFDVRIFALPDCHATFSFASTSARSSGHGSEIAVRGRYTSLDQVGKLGFAARHDGEICQASFESGLRIKKTTFARGLIAVTFGTIGINWGVCLGARGWHQFESKYLITHKNKWLAVAGTWNPAKRRLSWEGSLTCNDWEVRMTEQRSPKGVEWLFSSRLEKNGQSVECRKHSNGGFLLSAESAWAFATFGAWGGIDDRRPWPLFGARVTLTRRD
jgi:hypothetical protein